MSDLTIGDFWGIDVIEPSMNDGKGCSVVIVRTKKGEHLFEKINKDLICKSVSYEECIKFNPAEYKSVDRPENRTEFYHDLNLILFDDLVKKYRPHKTIFRKILSKTKRIVKNFILKNDKNGGGTNILKNENYGILLSFAKHKERGD